jgi:hypothetical protein
MTMLGAGLLAGAVLLTILVVIAIARDGDNDDEDVNLKEYDDWERLRGPSPASGPALSQRPTDVPSLDIAVPRGADSIAGVAQHS